MRETLFRAAQQGAYYPGEETVGQYQEHLLTRRCYEDSFLELELHTIAEPGPALILWPYPAGTADCIDRANCADIFARSNLGYRVLTELSLSRTELRDLRRNAEHLLIFASFEFVQRDLEVDSEGRVAYRGRHCSAIMSELIVGYLIRYGLFRYDPSVLAQGGTSAVTVPQLRTHVVNGSSVAAFKGLQMSVFDRYCRDVPEFSAIGHHVVSDELELQRVLAAASPARGLVIRPFSASQGAGVTFVDAGELARSDAVTVSRRVVTDVSAAMISKYGGDAGFPMTVTAFQESVLIDDCVSDLRIFVIYDPKAGGLRALPGMVRRAQVPLHSCSVLNGDCGLTNLNAPAAARKVGGSRIYPLASSSILRKLGLSEDRLIDLCRHAAAVWALAFADERSFFAAQQVRQFCYGSLDVLIRADDGTAVPIEMNGANVGSHPTVHPSFCDVFGQATTGALANLGLGRTRPRQSAPAGERP